MPVYFTFAVVAVIARPLHAHTDHGVHGLGAVQGHDRIAQVDGDLAMHPG